MKKYLAVFLALLMMFSLAACVGSDDANADSAGTASADAAASGSDEADAGDDAGAGVVIIAPDVDLPTKDDFPPGPAWTGETKPTRDNGPWAQSYAVIDALAGQASAYDGVEAERTFSLACHDPLMSASAEFLTAFADAVTIVTEGRVDFNIGYSEALSGAMVSLIEMQWDFIDFTWTLPSYFDGSMPLTNVIELPGLGIKNAAAGSHAMWELYKSNEEIQAGFADDGELLFVGTNGTSPLSYHGSGKILFSDINGSIRANRGPAKEFVEELGASAYVCSIGDVYSNIQNGFIDYVVTDWHAIKAFGLYDPDVLNYFIDTNVGSSAYALMAGLHVWDSIDSELQDAIKSASGDYLLNLVDIWCYWEAAGRWDAAANGGVIYEPDAGFAAALQEAYDNVTASWISRKYHPDDAQELYDQAQELVGQYNAQFDW